MHQIAVFIDGDNANHKHIKVCLEEIKKYGVIVCCRVYGDFSNNFSHWIQASNENGIEPIQCSRISGKNSTDIRLSIDVIELLHTVDTIDMYYLITSDSDFKHLIPKIKLKNKKVHCIGSEKSSSYLRSACDVFTKIEVLIRSGVTSIKNKVMVTNALSKETYKLYKNKIIELCDEKVKTQLSVVNERLQQVYQFDYREYGYSRFRPFIEDNFSNIVTIYKEKDGKTLCVELK